SRPRPATASASPSASRPAPAVARFVIHRRRFAVLGGTTLHVTGTLLPAASGRTVRLQGQMAAGWRTVAVGRTGRRGGFRLGYAPPSGTQGHLRVLFGGDRGTVRIAGDAGAVTVLRASVASWYEDAGGTACGFHAGFGVANRTLPCGTKVTLRYGGRTVTATVDDRGPFVAGRDWDLNQTTAAALGFTGVGTVWTSR
ncbi:MAG: septal ring lytic transglycosylase RlpA family protein, partial [Solirubrobacteraceae bacterium]